jgi:hypothetical protein
MRSPACLLALVAALLLLRLPVPAVAGRPLVVPRKPAPAEAAATARWLAAQNTWGVLRFTTYAFCSFDLVTEVLVTRLFDRIGDS